MSWSMDAYLSPLPQSTYRGRVEIGEVYLPSQLERTHYNFVRDGRYFERLYFTVITFILKEGGLILPS